MSSDRPRPLGIVRVLTDEQAPAWLDQSLKAAALDQAKLAAQKGAPSLPVQLRSPSWLTGVRGAWLAIAGSLASLLLAVMLVTGRQTPTETTTSEAGTIETKKRDVVAAPAAPAAATAAPTATSPAATEAPAAAAAAVSEATKPSTAPVSSAQSAVNAESDTVARRAAKASRQRTSAADAPAIAGGVSGPQAGMSKAEAKNPAPSEADGRDKSAIADTAVAERAVAESARAEAPVPPAAAKARANGDTYRVDSDVARGDSALAATTLPESAAQCIAAVQSLLGRERQAEAHMLYRRCSERFTSIDWPAAMRLRFVEPATAPR